MLNKTIERKSAQGVPMVHHYPKVIGGVCEWCGVKDPKARAEDQYKLCDHYKGMQLMCSYCPAEKNPDEVNAHASLTITDSPVNPSELVIVCDGFTCNEKHQKRFGLAV